MYEFILLIFIEIPTITEDLDYTRNDNGDGVFSVTSRGTNLAHKWYKNGRLIDPTEDNILEISNTSLRVKETDGSLRIAYEVSNVDYDNTTHSIRQTFGVYHHVSYTMILIAAPIMGLAICILIIICLILCICVIHLQKKNKRAPIETELIKRDGTKSGGMQRSEEDMYSCAQGCIKCNYEQSMKPDERLSLYAIRMVKDCSTDAEFLELLQQFLVKAKSKKKYDNKCRELCNKMIDEVDAVIEEIEPQEGDGPREIGLDGSKLIYPKYNINITLYLFLDNEHLLNDDQLFNDQHYRYNQYQDIRKILQEIAQQQSAE